MSEKIVMLGLSKEKGYFYFVDKDGDVSRAVMNRSGRPRKNT